MSVSLVQIADNLPLHQFSITELNKIYTRTKDLEMNVEVGTRGLKLENIRRYLEITSFFESPILRVVIDSQDFIPEIGEIKKTTFSFSIG